MADSQIEFKTILVPLDGSPLAEKALPYAADLASKYNATLLLLRVRGVPAAIWDAQEIPAIEAMQEQEKRICEDYLSGLSSSLSKQQPSVAVETAHEAGYPAEVIIEKSEDLPGAMIVITSHGRDGLRRWLMGSVAEKVARHATCPVVVVRGWEEE